MIETLLWRCPLCARNDALRQVVRRFRADLVRCTACGAAWRLRRKPGDGLYLRQLASGEERPLAAWYEAMKATLRLEAAPIPPWAATAPEGGWSAGEPVYLASGHAELWAEEGDPLFFAAPGMPDTARLDKARVGARLAGRGRLLLTDRRLVWHGEDREHSFPLARLNSAHAFLDDGLVLMVEMRLYTVRFLEESLLKWLTYMAALAPAVEASTGHRYTTSHC